MAIKPPKDVLVDRAVQIWKDLLREPTYDNGGDMVPLVSALAKQVPSNATAERLNAFGEALRVEIMRPLDSGLYPGKSMHVDYGPGATLKAAADEVGLFMEWPYKTDVFIEEDHVSVRSGYAAQALNHYPMDGGKRWLVTTLKGSEIGKVMEYVNGGSPSFRVEHV